MRFLLDTEIYELPITIINVSSTDGVLFFGPSSQNLRLNRLYTANLTFFFLNEKKSFKLFAHIDSRSVLISHLRSARI